MRRLPAVDTRARLLLALGLWLWVAVAWAAPSFPELTGRVVDNADMIDAAAEQQLTDMLAAHEQASGEQVVVVTLPDLGGETIEEYGYQLGRHWGIGQAGEDNGALLLVAKDERKVRIEVGYGLEGRLTDAQSSVIINDIITPAFRQGQFSQGIVGGSKAIIQVLGGDPLAEPERRSRGEAGEPSVLHSIGFFVLLVIIIALFGSGGGGGRGGKRRRGMGMPILMGGGFGGSSSGGFGGGGFSGGGGGFGGGGASGGW
ncbi:TPM domain-containing protein [Salinisphaera sp.]|uniref:TPM domain-containing protein n=1 Tax=Salinisphaera sp. TaxID=1914330 RepID=UPI000C3DE000|nr:TPM domain-containing protein [Salinisphaera sp.]MBS62733.1 methanol dehydrogenase [Salinisphaera sp.]